MRTRTSLRSLSTLNALMGYVLLPPAAFGLNFNTNPDDFPLDENCAAKPDDSVTVRINKSGDPQLGKPTATLIAPNFILTVEHWGNFVQEPPVTVDVGGSTYRIVDGRRGDAQEGPDLAVYRLETLEGQDADLTHWVDLYTEQDELGKEFVIGSYGPRPAEGEPAGTLHWGKNILVDGAPRTLQGADSVELSPCRALGSLVSSNGEFGGGDFSRTEREGKGMSLDFFAKETTGLAGAGRPGLGSPRLRLGFHFAKEGKP